MGLAAGCWLMTGELVLKKMLVLLLVSAMIEEIGSGRPRRKVDNDIYILVENSVSGFG
jgi:hypothetical protein